jgi:hypothetical protein
MRPPPLARRSIERRAMTYRRSKVSFFGSGVRCAYTLSRNRTGALMTGVERARAAIRGPKPVMRVNGWRLALTHNASKSPPENAHRCTSRQAQSPLTRAEVLKTLTSTYRETGEGFRDDRHGSKIRTGTEW